MVRISVAGTTYLGNSVSMTCVVTLIGVSVNDLDVALRWTRDDNDFTGDTTTGVSIRPLLLAGVIVQSTIDFDSLWLDNGGSYQCSTTINRKGQSDSSVSANDDWNLIVVGKHLRTFHFKRTRNENIS